MNLHKLADEMVEKVSKDDGSHVFEFPVFEAFTLDLTNSIFNSSLFFFIWLRNYSNILLV